MPYHLKWDGDRVAFHFSGDVSSQDIVESNQRVYGDPRFDDIRWQLVFFDEATSASFKAEDVRLVAYMDGAAATSNPRVTVVFIGSGEVMNQVETTYSQAKAEPPWPVLTFDSRAEAISYIEQKG